jgi:signal transduction histidine kinase
VSFDLTVVVNDVVRRLAVVDTGLGIPEEKRALIFQQFTQADSSTTRKHGAPASGLPSAVS